MDRLIDKYVKGKATPAEIEVLQKYLSNSDLSLLKSKMAQDWKEELSREHSMDQQLSKEMLEYIHARIRSKESSRPRKTIRWISAAAAIIIVALGLSLWLTSGQEGNIQRYSTEYGEQRLVSLPDGSMVTLNANSSLRLNKEWSKEETRKVWLEGEAYFQVIKKYTDEIKFQVITSDLTVEVLGTSFSVNNRSETTQVFLDEGKISLNTAIKSMDPVIMEPGEVLTYSSEEQKIIEHKKAASDLHTSWKDGVLTFRETPVKEVLTKMEDIYGVHFKVSNENILKKTMTTGVPMESLDIAISFISKSMNVEITVEQDTLVIY